MARYCLFEPGNPSITNPGGWGDYTATNATLATLKAVYDPVIASEVALSGLSTQYSTTHTAHIIDTEQDPPEVVSRSCITDIGEAGWVDV